jgi:hypothetical protein
MRRKSTKIAVAIAVIAAVAAGGAALTAANDIPATSVAGYDSSTITGATATALTYTLSADGTEITDAALTFTGDVTDRTITAGFDNDATLRTCTPGAFAGGVTPVTCSGFHQDTTSSASFHVAVVETP